MGWTGFPLWGQTLPGVPRGARARISPSRIVPWHRAVTLSSIPTPLPIGRDWPHTGTLAPWHSPIGHSTGTAPTWHHLAMVLLWDAHNRVQRARETQGRRLGAAWEHKDMEDVQTVTIGAST